MKRWATNCRTSTPIGERADLPSSPSTCFPVRSGEEKDRAGPITDQPDVGDTEGERLTWKGRVVTKGYRYLCLSAEVKDR